jgi:hypothetical protein
MAGRILHYYFYVDGDVGRQVQITYFGAVHQGGSKPKNHDTTITATLPFVGGTDVVSDGGNTNNIKNAYLKVCTDIGDNTTRAVIFGNLERTDGGVSVYEVFFSMDNSITKDSAINYIKKVSPNRYIEFKSDQICKTVKI